MPLGFDCGCTEIVNRGDLRRRLAGCCTGRRERSSPNALGDKSRGQRHRSCRQLAICTCAAVRLVLNVGQDYVSRRGRIGSARNSAVPRDPANDQFDPGALRIFAAGVRSRARNVSHSERRSVDSANGKFVAVTRDRVNPIRISVPSSDGTHVLANAIVHVRPSHAFRHSRVGRNGV